MYSVVTDYTPYETKLSIVSEMGDSKNLKDTAILIKKSIGKRPINCFSEQSIEW